MVFVTEAALSSLMRESINPISSFTPDFLLCVLCFLPSSSKSQGGSYFLWRKLEGFSFLPPSELISFQDKCQLHIFTFTPLSPCHHSAMVFFKCFVCTSTKKCTNKKKNTKIMEYLVRRTFKFHILLCVGLLELRDSCPSWMCRFYHVTQPHAHNF